MVNGVDPGAEQQIPVVLISEDYRLLECNDAYRRKANRGIQLGISHCYEVSHGYPRPCHEQGEACPLQQCRSTGLAQRVLHVHQTREGPEYCDIIMQPAYDASGRLRGYQEAMRVVEHASSTPKRNSLIGRSPAFQKMLALINRVAPTDVSVLLQGETGTGKEIVAKTLHEESLRKHAPFIVVECTGLSEALFESELFGYRKGAFTGAAKDKQGLVDAANGGTLFLDEVGDIPLSLQVKLLRLLETGSYRPVGGIDAQRSNFRLISASHKDLAALVASGQFRQDLYYRLAAFPIVLPPLRQRREDLPLLCEVFLRQQAEYKPLAASALAQLARYEFPGNIRELRNLLQRAYLMTDGNEIGNEQLPEPTWTSPVPEREALSAAPHEVWPLSELEQHYLLAVSNEFQGRMGELAVKLGISERTLYRKLAQARRASDQAVNA